MTSRRFLTFLLFCTCLTAGAQTFTEWQDPAVFEVNKLHPRANISQNNRSFVNDARLVESLDYDRRGEGGQVRVVCEI